MELIIYTFDKAKNKKVIAGKIKNGIFYRKVKESKHLMLKMDAFAQQEDVIQQLINHEVSTLIFESKEKIYTSKLMRWLQSDIKVLDYGHGKQRFMPRRFMEIQHKK
jgi:hypothetical protein